jgi:predicted MFS family arabinose efflux permease
MRACIETSAPLFAAAAVLAVLLALRARRAADPIVPLDLLRTRTVAVAAAALFLTTAALFAVNVFVPLFLQTTTGASPTEAGLLLVPMMLGITVSTNLAGRALHKGARPKPFPLAGLALMTVALLSLALAAGHPSQLTTSLALIVFGFGFGMVGQVLIVTVQNDVDRRQLGTAMATTNFARGLGGAVGAAALGAVFSARSGGAAQIALSPALRADVIGAIQTVFLVAAPIAALALLVVAYSPTTPRSTNRAQ